MMRTESAPDGDPRGTFSVADADLPPGAAVLVENPLVGVLKDQFVRSVCSACLRRIPEGAPVVDCPGCRWAVAYCCEDCRDLHRDDIHGRECGLLGRMDVETDPDADTALLRLAVTVAALGKGPQLDAFMKLSPCRDVFPKSTVDEVEYLAGTVDKLLDDEHRANFPDGLENIFYRILANKFSLVGPDFEDETSIGIAIYPRASFFNHSCRPNALFAHHGRSCSQPEASDELCTLKSAVPVNTLTIRVLRPVTAGEAITIPYTRDLLYPRRERIEALKSEFSFTCCCPLCTGDIEDPVPEPVAKDKAIYAQANGACEQAKSMLFEPPEGSNIKDTLPKAAIFLQQAMGEFGPKLPRHSRPIVTLLTLITTACKMANSIPALVHHSNAVIESLVRFLDVDQKAIAAELPSDEDIEAFRATVPTFPPLIGLAGDGAILTDHLSLASLHMIIALCLHRTHLQMAIDQYQYAFNILAVTRGREHQYTRSVAIKLRDAIKQRDAPKEEKS